MYLVVCIILLCCLDPDASHTFVLVLDPPRSRNAHTLSMQAIDQAAIIESAREGDVRQAWPMTESKPELRRDAPKALETSKY